MVPKKIKRGRDAVDGFDATPPGDGDMAAGNGKRPGLQDFGPLNGGKQGIKKYLSAYWAFLKQAFRNAPRFQQEAWITRFAQICCIGVSCIVLNSFYSVLLPPIRIISLPILVGAAWYVANKIVTPAIIKRLGNNMNSN